MQVMQFFLMNMSCTTESGHLKEAGTSQPDTAAFWAWTEAHVLHSGKLVAERHLKGTIPTPIMSGVRWFFLSSHPGSCGCDMK